MAKPKLLKQTFEIRYERGYRYLDRCGEALLVFDEALPEETGKVWLPQETLPTGAKLKCPELDLHLVFDSNHLVLDQDPVDQEADFAGIAKLAFSIISGRFDLNTVIRLGFRRFFMLAADSVEMAEKLSVKFNYPRPWPGVDTKQFPPRSADVAAVFEAEDESEGYRISATASVKAGALEVVDERTTARPRLLPKGQKEALVAQMRRHAQREKNPLAGVGIDVDYYWTKAGQA